MAETDDSIVACLLVPSSYSMPGLEHPTGSTDTNELESTLQTGSVNNNEDDDGDDMMHDA